MGTVSELSRPEKRELSAGLLAWLLDWQKKGLKEEALEAFIPWFQSVIAGLDTGVTGKAVANAERKAQLARSEKADSDVDASLRHHYYFLDIEAMRRVGPFVLDAIALRDAAFPDGLAFIDEYIPVENQTCRDAIAILKSGAHAQTVENLELPSAWITKWETEIAESDAAFADVQKARDKASANVETGVDAEDECVDLVIRYRRYILSRASKSDKVKIAEGVEALKPLSTALGKARAEAAARATRKKTAAKGPEGSAPEGTAGTSGTAGAPKPQDPK